MPEVDQYIGVIEEVGCRITGPVAGITADQDRESLIPERSGNLARAAFQSGRELESHGPGTPFPQFPDEIRNTGQ